MSIVRELLVGFVGLLLVLAVAACGSAPASAAPVTNSQGTSLVSATPPQPAGDVIWGRVPYCNCLATSATANVADALKKANLTVNLKELSPSDGWLYFAVRFDPATATDERVATAMQAGGAEILSGPP